MIRCKKDAIVTGLGSLPQCIRMSPTQWGVVGSSYTLGGLVGALSAGPLSGRYGRRRTMQLTAVFFTLGPVFEALAPNMGVLAFGRLVSGVGAGASVVVVPIYISEIAPAAEKGFFGALTQVMCNVGILITQLLGYFLSHGQKWRIILAAGGFIGVVQGLGLVLTTESPKYLAEQGDTVQAKRVLRKIRGSRSDIDEEVSGWTASADEADGGVARSIRKATTLANSGPDEEQSLLRGQDPSSTDDAGPKRKGGKEDALSIVQVFRHPDYRKAAFAVIMIMLAQQLSGTFAAVQQRCSSGLHLHYWARH